MDGSNEQHLAILLKKFNTKMYLDYALKTEKIIQTCGGSSEFTTLEVMKTSDGAGDLAFRASFDFPTYIMLSHPLCRFRSHRNYPIGERYLANMGLVPVYFSSVGIMSVLKLWGERATSFFSPTNNPLPDSADTCWELPPASKPSVFSSMNFIEQNGSNPEIVDPHLTEIFRKYFKFLFWEFPHPGFAPSTHFLHGAARISSQVKISKSLYVIEQIDGQESLFMEGKSLDGTGVLLRGLTLKDGNLYFQSFPAMLDSELVQETLSHEPRTSFINGVVAEVTQKARDEQRLFKRSLMTVIADYGESYFDIITSLLGMFIDHRYEETDSLTEIGATDAVIAQVRAAYLNIWRLLRVERTMSDVLPNIFQLAIDTLFPAVVEDGGKLYYIHPLVWGLLKKWKLIRENKDEQKQILISFLKLLKLSEHGSSMTVYLDENADYFQNLGVSKREFTRSVFLLGKAIRLLKEMRKTLEMSSPKTGITGI